MTDKKISQLTGATTPLSGAEVLPIVQSGVTKKVATDDLTVKNIRSNATNGILQIAGPAAGTTRTMTTPDANFTAARTDAAQTFTETQTLSAAVNLLSGANASGQINGDTTYQTILTEGGAASYIVFAGNSAPGIHARAVFIASSCFGSGTVATLIQSSFNGQSLSIQWSGNNLQLKNAVNTSGSQPAEGFISYSAIKIL